MLQLKNITKDYAAGGETVHALRDVSLCFRQSEFVCVLGPSGCGKTTLLNIVGGLDQYTSGDLVINGRSTRQFSARDWDTYRNHSVGFVFQNYNLIPHQSVLANVELALTLSGVSRTQRRQRAVQALETVGLGSQLHKRPNQLSGGQMQRVAIARALVNQPDILLADEPTGALDTETSVQIMELLKEISRRQLVVMVTHNPELADRYSTRIIRLLDGRILSDSAPCTPQEAEASAAAPAAAAPKRYTSMSVATAMALSLNNLLTKKARTLLTAFAGSIGIIGIALILSLSNGIQNYIDRVQEDTLSSYPITIEAEQVDMSSLVGALMGAGEDARKESRAQDRVYASTVLYDMLDAMTNAETQTNDLAAFRQFLESDEELRSHLSAVQVTYDLPLNIYTTDPTGAVVRSDLQALMETVYGDMFQGNAYAQQYTGFANMQLWEQMLPGEDGQLVSELLEGQYDLLYGRWPQAADEVVLFVNENNELSDLVLYALGLRSGEELSEVVRASMAREPLAEKEEQSFSYHDLCTMTFKLLLPDDRWQQDAAGVWHDLAATDTGLQMLYNDADTGVQLRVVGILRPNEDAVSAMMGGAIGYTTALSDLAMQATNDSAVVRAQMDAPDTDVLVGLPFADEDAPAPTQAQKAESYRAYAAGLDVQAKAEQYAALLAIPDDDYVAAAVAQGMEGLTRADVEGQLLEAYAAQMEADPQVLAGYIAEMDDETLMGYVQELMAQNVRAQYAQQSAAATAAMTPAQLAAGFDAATLTEQQWAWLYDNYMPPTTSESTLQQNLQTLGWTDPEAPASVSLYAATFADKDAIADCIARYNDGVAQEQQITYTDYVALLMSSITTIINAISYVLIAFVAISLVVSSIMIGIITYISVLERTKEIGILRAIGASRRDIGRVFNAETLIVGFTAGAIGIGVTLLLTLPINAIIHHLTGIATLSAVLPAAAGAILVAISMLLTFIAGLIPSRLAARKDPVVALRTE